MVSRYVKVDGVSSKCRKAVQIPYPSSQPFEGPFLTRRDAHGGLGK